MCCGSNVLVCVCEGGGGAGARSEEGPGDCAVGGEDEDDGNVGDGFCASGGGVAVDDAFGGRCQSRKKRLDAKASTVLGHGFGVDPVEACASARIYLARLWEE